MCAAEVSGNNAVTVELLPLPLLLLGEVRSPLTRSALSARLLLLLNAALKPESDDSRGRPVFDRGVIRLPSEGVDFSGLVEKPPASRYASPASTVTRCWRGTDGCGLPGKRFAVTAETSLASEGTRCSRGVQFFTSEGRAEAVLKDSGRSFPAHREMSSFMESLRCAQLITL